MLPKKGFTYKCKMSFNQYVKNEIYKCVQDGYLEVNGLNYRIQDEKFFEGYFSIYSPISLSYLRDNHKILTNTGLTADEECLDQANYLKRAILEIENKQG